MPAFWLRYAALIDSIREAIDKRIRAVIPGDEGSIASALITGKRDAISTPVNDAMYVSSLAHVLSISGYHMAVVAGIVFFFIRAGLALLPLFASRYPIKKWAAAAALSAAAFYLLLSGAEVATQRSFIMIAIVLVGVLVDRPTLTFRTITVAAFGVLVLAPESVVQPSFQMSFAATLALIAAYQYGLPWRANADSSFGARVALWGGREIFGLALASLVAGLATTPYAAFHFHRAAPYGVHRQSARHAGGVGRGDADGDSRRADDAVRVRCDLLETDGRRHRLDGQCGAVGCEPAGRGRPCARVRYRSTAAWNGGDSAAVPAADAAALERSRACRGGEPVGGDHCRCPDVLVSGDGQAAAICGADGRLAVLYNARDTFAIKEWLAANEDTRTVKDASLHDGVQCDAAGCIGRLGDGRLVSFALSIEAFAEDCARAAVVVSARGAGRLRRYFDRPQCMARQWRHRVALDRRAVRAQRGASVRLRAAMG